MEDVNGTKFTIEVAQKILGPNLAKTLGEKSVGDYFKKYNKQNKIVFLSEFQQVMTMMAEGDKDMLASWRLWNSQNGGKKTMADYAAYQADRTVTDMALDNTKVPGVDTAGNTGATGPTASFIDPYVQTLREAVRLGQGITVGWKASLAALKNYNAESMKTMSGQAVLLQQAGASEGLIQAFLGGTEEDQNRMFAKAKGGISDVARFVIKQAKLVENAKIGMEYILAGTTGRMEKDNQLYQAGLDVIASKEKKINEKYDKRVKALDEISKLQERNNQQQQDTLDLADALSKGDIAAAARAAMNMRQNEQRVALEKAKEGIERARQDELSTVSTKILGETQTRADLEGKIAVNSEKIALAKKNELDSQVAIGKQALANAQTVTNTLNTLKGFSKIKLPVIKASAINTNVINTNSVNDGGSDSEQDDTGTDYKKTFGNTLKSLKGVKGIAGTRTASILAERFGDLKSGQAETDYRATEYEKQQTALSKIRNTAGLTNMYQVVLTGDPTTIAAYRGQLATPELKTIFDQLYKDYTTAKSNVANSKDRIAGKIEDEFKNLPPEVQSAFTQLKEYRKGREAVAQPYRDAKKKWDNFIAINPENTWNDADKTKGEPLRTDKDAKHKALEDYDKLALPIQRRLEALGYGVAARKLFAGYARGGYVMPQYFNMGGSAWGLGTDTIPAMLTPGEFVIKKSSVDSIGVDKLNSMNSGAGLGESVYNYTIQVNVKSDVNANQIADTVLRQIEKLDAQRLRSVRL